MRPVLFSIPVPWGSGEQPVFSYGVMLALSFIAGWYIVGLLGEKKDGLDRDALGNAYLVTAIAAVVGARILYVLTNLDAFEGAAGWFDVTSGGMVAYGGFLGGFAGAAVYLRRKDMSLAAFGDAAAPALACGTMLTRIGCYLYGCDFGARLDEGEDGVLASLGTFPHWDSASGLTGSPAFVHHVNTYGLAAEATHAYPVHPTQLYESFAGLLLLGLCGLIWHRRAFVGQVLLTFVFGYSLWRFFLEYLRDDPERGAAFGFSTSQLISLALMPVAMIAYSLMRRNRD